MSHPGHIRHPHFTQSNFNELHEKPDNVFKVGNQDQEMLMEKIMLLNSFSNNQLIDEYNKEVVTGFTGMSSQVLQLLAFNYVMLNRFGKSPIKFKNNILNLGNEESFSDEIFIDIIEDICYTGRDIGKLVNFLNDHLKKERKLDEEELKKARKKQRMENYKILKSESYKKYIRIKERESIMGPIGKVSLFFDWILWKTEIMPRVFQLFFGLLLTIFSLVGFYLDYTWLESISLSFWGVFSIIVGGLVFPILLYMILIGISIVFSKRRRSD